MKRIAITLGATALWLIPVTAAAQAPGARPSATSAARPMRIGLTLGLNRASVSGSDVPDELVDSKLGAVFGATLSYELSQSIALQPEIVYTMKGAQVDFGDFIEASTVSLDYIAVPLLVQARIPTRGGATPFVLGGPSLGFLVRAELEDNGDSEDIGDQTNDLDIGVVIGGGVEFATRQGTFVFAVRYEIGVTDVSEDPDDGNVNNRAFSLGFGFLF